MSKEIPSLLTEEDKERIRNAVKAQAIQSMQLDLSEHREQYEEDMKALRANPARIERVKLATDKLAEARQALILKAPFIGAVSARLVLKEADFATALATDGEHQFFDLHFVEDMSEHDLMFGLANNALHLIFDHLGRKGDRHHTAWNIANDIIIADMLLKAGFEPPVENTMLDPRFDSDIHTSEEVYDIILPELQAGKFYSVKDGKPEVHTGTPIANGIEFDVELDDEVVTTVFSLHEKGKGEDDPQKVSESKKRIRESNKAIKNLRKDPSFGPHAPKIKG